MMFCCLQCCHAHQYSASIIYVDNIRLRDSTYILSVFWTERFLWCRISFKMLQDRGCSAGMPATSPYCFPSLYSSISRNRLHVVHDANKRYMHIFLADYCKQSIPPRPLWLRAGTAVQELQSPTWLCGCSTHSQCPLEPEEIARLWWVNAASFGEDSLEYQWMLGLQWWLVLYILCLHLDFRFNMTCSNAMRIFHYIRMTHYHGRIQALIFDILQRATEITCYLD